MSYALTPKTVVRGGFGMFYSRFQSRSDPEPAYRTNGLVPADSSAFSRLRLVLRSSRTSFRAQRDSRWAPSTCSSPTKNFRNPYTLQGDFDRRARTDTEPRPQRLVHVQPRCPAVHDSRPESGCTGPENHIPRQRHQRQPGRHVHDARPTSRPTESIAGITASGRSKTAARAGTTAWSSS